MPLENKLYTALTGSTLITATTTRIFPVVAPPETILPFITYVRVNGGQINTLSGYATVENPSVQIDVFSTGYSQAKTLADNIHSVINTTTTFRSILKNDSDLFEEDINAYRITMDFTFINRE